MPAILPMLLRVTATVAALSLSLIGAAFLTKPERAVHPIVASKTLPPPPTLIRGNLPDPELTAEAIFIQRLRTGEILLQRNPDLRLPIASLTKLITALALAEIGHPLHEVVFTEAAKAAGAPDEKRSAVAAGDRLKIEDVIKLLVVSSDADAAYAAAEFMAARIERGAETKPFSEQIGTAVRYLNSRAGAIGMTSTTFTNPSGADGQEHLSTARDISTLVIEIERSHRDIWAASRIQESFVFGRSGKRYPVVNTNPLLAKFPSIYGSKTGYEDTAKGALAMLYQLADGELVSVVILRSANRFGDGERILRWLDQNFSFAKQD